jgi:2'-5' RNA ligase
MPYGVMLYFDDQTEKTILNIWQSLAENNLSSGMLDAGIRPHITLAIYEELDCRSCENVLTKITTKTASLPIQFTHLGIFTNPEPVVFASPLVTKELLDFHKDLQARLANEGKNPWELYIPGQWVPHCTLSLGYKIENQAEIIRICQTMSLPMDVRAVQLGVVNFKPVKDLFNYDFRMFEG